MKNCTFDFNNDMEQPLLKVKDVTVNFGGLMALANIDFEISDRKIQGLIGPNGAGKTTLFNTITGFIKIDWGEITYKGKSLIGLAAHDIGKIGIIRTFQLGGIFPDMSVLENMMTGYYRKSKANIFEISFRLKNAKLEEDGIKDRAYDILKFFKIDKLSEKSAGDLSFGQQRLVEIGRALMSEPKLLLTDEPAAGLSSAERNQVIDLLKMISDERGICIFLADHSMDFVMEICDNIIVLNYGVKIAQGNPNEIKENSKVLEAYLGKGER